MSSRKNRYRKGTIEWVGRPENGCWHARVTIPGEPRQRVKLSTPPPESRPLTDREGDRALALELAAELSEVMRSEAYERTRAKLPPRTTVEAFGNLLTSGKLYQDHGEVRGLKDKKTSKSDETRLKAHVYPYIGNTPVADLTELDVERAFARAAQAAEKKLGRPWRQASKFQVYQVMHRLFDLAIKPGRLRTDNPVSRDLKPRRDKPKLYGFLYPVELLALLACSEIPLGRRAHYALAVYTGLRKASLAALTWVDVDFQHGTLTSLTSKTGLPQLFEISPDLVRVLERWREHCGNPEDNTPVIRGLECREGREAETLRADLKAANVTRAVLFSKAANVERLRFHDARATFVTWARRAGYGWGWTSDRTGHLTPAMMERYDRGARTLADLKYEPFPDLSKAIPELSDEVANVVRLADFRRE